MPLVERLLGVASGEGETKIPIHQFQALVGEWARGNVTTQQAQAAVASMSRGNQLDAASVAELQALIATVPTGSTNTDKINRLLRLMEIDQILLLADRGVPPYNDPAFLRTRLGI